MLPYVCMLVDSVDHVGDFVVNVFGCQDDETLTKPVLHRVIVATSGSSIILVQKGSCNVATLATFSCLAVKHVFIAVDDPAEVWNRAGNVGGDVSVNAEPDGSSATVSYFEGTSELIFHALKSERGRPGPNPHDVLMNKIWSQLEKDADAPDGVGVSSGAGSGGGGAVGEAKGSPTPVTTPVATAKKPRDAPRNPRPIIRGLEVTVLSNNSKSYVPCPPNARTPVPFETEIFKGHVLLILRTDPPDPHFRSLFEGNKRMFELQVQGRFKRLPQGELMVGGESSNEMQLGMIMRTICKTVCNFAGTVVSDLHYSFGDSQKKEDYELPHMAAPLFPTMNKLIETPVGREPPALGQVWEEDPDHRKRRAKFKTTDEGKLNIESTYSFSVASSNIDLVKWESCGIPMVKPMNLRTIFGDSDFTFVTYELMKSVAQRYPNKHPHKFLNYALNIKIRGLGDPNKAADMYLHDEEEDEDSEDEDQSPPTTVRGAVVTPTADTARKINPNEDVSYFSSRGRGGNLSVDALTARGALSSDDEAAPRPAKAGASRLAVGAAASDDDDDDEEDDDEARCGFVDTGGSLDLELETAHDEEHEEHEVQDEEDDDDEEDDEGFEDGDGDESTFSGRRAGGSVGGWAGSLARARRSNRFTGERERIENLASAAKRKVSGWFRRSVGNDDPVVDVPETPDYVVPNYEAETDGDLRYCPACIEVNDRRLAREGRRRVLFVLPWATNEAGTDLQPRLRSYTEITSTMAMVPIPKTHKLKKVSIEEKKRIQVAESYKLSLSQGLTPTKLRTLLHATNDTDTNFLGGFVPVKKFKKGLGAERWEGNVAMATSRRHWAEQCMQLTRTEVLLRKNHDAIRVTLRIPFRSIIRIRPMPAEAEPFSGLSYFQIDTVARVYYFAVRSDRQVEEWMQAFQSAVSPVITQVRDGLFEMAHIAEVDFYLARPPSWRMEKRRLFNCRRIVFTRAGLAPELKQLATNPVALITRILQKALRLAVIFAEQTTGLFSTEDIALWVSFLDEISALQTLNVTQLTEKEKAVFYLNMYHVMVIHGSLVIGPPPAWSSWPSFFNNISYLFCFDIVSIAEVEHNLLRAAMSRPSTVLTKIPAPTTQFPGLALTQRDFRLNFCINNGSLSMLPYVPVYEVDRLDAQLDDMTSRLLEDAVEIDMNKRVVTLPKVCCWYLADFATRRIGAVATSPGADRGAQPVPVDSLRVLVHYFKREEKEKIVRLLLDSTPPNVKFRHPNFRCRVLMAEDVVTRGWDRYRQPSSSESHDSRSHDSRHHRPTTFVADEQHRHPSF